LNFKQLSDLYAFFLIKIYKYFKFQKNNFNKFKLNFWKRFNLFLNIIQKKGFDRECKKFCKKSALGKMF